MRIALITETFFPAVDGTTTTVKAIADRLIDTGHQILIVAPGPGLSDYRGSPVARIGRLERTGVQVREALDRFRPDLIQVTSPGRLGRKALTHAQRVGARSLLIQQTPVPDLDWDRWHDHAQRADRVLVTADWMADRLAGLGVRSRVWLPGVDTAAFSPALRDQWLHDRWAKARTGRPLVLVGYVGGLQRSHGVRRLAALAEVPGIRPVVIGAGPQRDWLRSRLPGAVFTGPMGIGDLTVAMATLDVLVHPGTEETCAHPLREAAASGVPVVAARSGGAVHVVDHQVNGLLHRPGSRADFLRAVTAVAADPRRALLGAAGRELAGRRSWPDAVDELVSLHHPAPDLTRPDEARTHRYQP